MSRSGGWLILVRIESNEDSGDQLAPGLSRRYCYICMVKNKLRCLLGVLEAK